MSNQKITVDAGDLMQTIATLSHIPTRIRNKAIRIGLNKAGSIIRNKIIAPVETGALQKSLGIKVKQTKATKDWHVTVGANRRARMRRKKGEKVKRRPSRYLHLVNSGTKRGVPALRFMEAAAAAAGPEVVATVAKRIVSEVLGLTNKRS